MSQTVGTRQRSDAGVAQRLAIPAVDIKVVLPWLPLVPAVATFVVATISLRQLSELRRNSKGTAAERFLRELGTDDMSKARHKVIRAMGDLVVEESLDADTCWRVVRSFDRVGLYVDHKLIDESLVLDMYCESVIDCWERLRGVVATRRGDNESGTSRHNTYAHHFERLNERAERYALRSRFKTWYAGRVALRPIRVIPSKPNSSGLTFR